jgi:hypothetical protein
MKSHIRDHWRMRVIVRVFAFTRNDSENLVEWAAGLFTGLAQEMQKGVRRQAEGV